MLRVWLVVLLFGKVGASIGPLPDDEACLRRMAELSSAFDQRFEADAVAGARKPRQDGRDIERSDFTLECRRSQDPPAREIQLR